MLPFPLTTATWPSCLWSLMIKILQSLPGSRLRFCKSRTLRRHQPMIGSCCVGCFCHKECRYKRVNLKEKKSKRYCSPSPRKGECCERRHRGAGRVGERTAEGGGLGLGPVGGDAGRGGTTIQQAMFICTPFEGNTIIRVRYSYYIKRVETVMRTRYE